MATPVKEEVGAEVKEGVAPAEVEPEAMVTETALVISGDLVEESPKGAKGKKKAATPKGRGKAAKVEETKDIAPRDKPKAIKEKPAKKETEKKVRRSIGFEISPGCGRVGAALCTYRTWLYERAYQGEAIQTPSHHQPQPAPSHSITASAHRFIRSLGRSATHRWKWTPYTNSIHRCGSSGLIRRWRSCGAWSTACSPMRCA
jgi:hypothetical protein